MKTTNAHTLNLTTWGSGENYLEDNFDYWDTAEISCPHPKSAYMDCAVWEPCGCEPGHVGELDLFDVDSIETGDWPCSTSVTKIHRYIEGEPNKPLAQCWSLEWDTEIEEYARELHLPAGTYFIHPRWDGGNIKFDLIDPLIKT